MTIDFSIRSRSNRNEPAAREADINRTEHGPARIACLLALAHRFEGLLASRAVKDYAELARLGHVSRARITQIMHLLELAPAIQEHLLGLNGSAKTITERHLRSLLHETRWDRQVALFRELVSASEAFASRERLTPKAPSPSSREAD